MKKGIINISLGIILIFFSALSALLLSYLFKDAINVEKKIIETVDNTYSKILYISGANIWRKFLTENAAYWDDIQAEFEDASISGNSTRTQMVLNTYLEYNLGSKKKYDYTLVSTTTTYIFEEKYINVIFEILKNEAQLSKGMSFDFGWPGI
ncbi:hypothetical protein HNP65_000710 [Thermosipho japonicus]|uniref:Methyl-accepting chemotaxis protein n=1 Tax=Thermosipho japonicus TaxID=90323 RepID=A0A841GRX0_9BACT|nr:hypothetical protein [Thermosipho japonicus]MBB6062288.1 hypothetical protein [Thermosipho japonicus]